MRVIKSKLPKKHDCHDRVGRGPSLSRYSAYRSRLAIAKRRLDFPRLGTGRACLLLMVPLFGFGFHGYQWSQPAKWSDAS